MQSYKEVFHMLTNVIFFRQLCVTSARLPSSTTWEDWARSWPSREPGIVEVSPDASSWGTKPSTSHVSAQRLHSGVVMAVCCLRCRLLSCCRISAFVWHLTQGTVSFSRLLSVLIFIWNDQQTDVLLLKRDIVGFYINLCTASQMSEHFSPKILIWAPTSTC